MKNLSSLFAFFFLIGAEQAQGIVVLYEIISGDATSSTPTQSSIVTNMNPGVTSATGYLKGAGIEYSASGGTFNVTAWDPSVANAAAAVTANEVITWSFNASQPFDLSDFSIRYDRSTSGPSQLQISFNDGSGFVPVHTDTAVNSAGEDNFTIDLSAFDNVTSGTFRLAAFGASASTGTFDFENSATINPAGASFQLRGELSPIPEPASLSALSLGLLAIGRRRRA